ncbi:MAG: 50S ribosomal protein L37ae [Halobacteriota archaeon]|nr:50S ribosomal protein L37ae [Halobacteriota archaeon]MDY6959122.1 50S ribosomal protein L37ae [Halobacteriota archaeon]
MAKKYTKKGRKSRSAGRYGVRYGRKARKIIADIEDQMHAKHMCPRCGKLKVSRVGTGIWRCSVCDLTFAGGTYIPQTSAGKSVKSTIKKVLEQE